MNRREFLTGLLSVPLGWRALLKKNKTATVTSGYVNIEHEETEDGLITWGAWYVDDPIQRGPPVSADIAELWNVVYGAWAYLTQDGEAGWFLWDSETETWERCTGSGIWQCDVGWWHHWDVGEQGIYHDGALAVEWGGFDFNVGSAAVLDDLPADLTMTIDADIVAMPGTRACHAGFRIISDDTI